MPPWLQREVTRSLGEQWGGAVESLVFGPDPRADRIVESVATACVETCGSELTEGFLYTVSVGCVFGCVLADGRRVVLKAYQPRWTVPFLEAVRRTQRHLHRGGFPCPEPLGDVVHVDGAMFVAEREHPDPGVGPLDASRAEASAAGLAEVINRCRALDEPSLALHPLRDPLEGLFPEPHSPIFDFAATAAGSEWIDELARRAVTIMARDVTPEVIAHTDWAARNVRIDDRRGVVAVYDWDSLAFVKECVALGSASVTWSKTGEDGEHTPSADDIDAYLDAYEVARGTALGPALRRSTRAAAVRSMAYTARCEHALDPTGQCWTTTRDRLRTDADALLS